MFVLGSKIKIGTVGFSGVHELEVRKSLFSYVQTGEIKLPGRIRLRKRNNANYLQEVETYKQFKEGDAVTIQLAASGVYNEEFKGFVRRVDQAMPVRIELEGYSYQLKKKFIQGKFWKSTTVKEIMEYVVSGTDIKLIVDADIAVENFPVVNATGAEVLDSIIKDIGLKAITAYFITHDTLWIGLNYTKYQKTVKYQLGRNVIKDDQLVKRIVDKSDVKYEVVYTDNAGTRTRNQPKTVGGNKVIKSRFVSDASNLSDIADAKAQQVNYEGLQGEITTFLEPYIVPGDKALIGDNRYDRNGGFICESLKVNYGVRGARRGVGIGLKVD